MKSIYFVGLVLLSIFAVGAELSYAETVTLRDGKVIEGEIIENKDDYITIKIDGKENVIRKHRIDKIEAKAGSGDAKLARTPAPPQPRRKVQLYMTSWCPYCIKMEQFLIANKIPYKRLDVENNETAERDFRDYGGRGVPMVVVGDEVIGGYDPEEVMNAWARWNRQ